MRRNGFLDSCIISRIFYHDKYHIACEMSTSTIQEDIVFLTWLDCHQIPVYIPKIDFFQSLTRNRNDAFLVTFTYDPNKLFFFKHIAFL